MSHHFTCEKVGPVKVYKIGLDWGLNCTWIKPNARAGPRPCIKWPSSIHLPPSDALVTQWREEKELSYKNVPLVHSHKNLTSYRFVPSSSQMTLSRRICGLYNYSGVKSTEKRRSNLRTVYSFMALQSHDLSKSNFSSHMKRSKLSSRTNQSLVNTIHIDNGC